MKKITKSKPVSAPGGGPLDIFKREMEQLRNDFQARNAAVNAAYGEILNSINRVYRAVDSAVLKEREDTEKKDMMDMMKAYNEDCRRSVSEVTEAETYRVGCQYPEVFIAQSLASDNDQDRFQRQDNSKDRDRPRPAPSRTRRRPRSSQPGVRPSLDTGRTRGWPFREICWMQRLAWRRSPRRDPATVIRANVKKIGDRQNRDRPRPAPSCTRRRPRSSQPGVRPSSDTGRTRGWPFREICWMQRLAGQCSHSCDPGLSFGTGPGPDYLGGHFFGV